MKKIILICMMVFIAVLSLGCSKNKGGSDVANKFVEDFKAGKAFVASVHFVDGDETLEMTVDANGNYKIKKTYSDGEVEEIYKIDNVYSLYYDGVEESTEGLEANLEEIFTDNKNIFLTTVEYSLDVFDVEFDTAINESKEEKAYIASGDYEEGEGTYAYYYAFDGSFFKLIDSFESTIIEFDDSVVIETP